MKYTIMGFQQEKLIELGLKTDDALVLNCIKDMYASPTMEFKNFDGIRYMWINYTWLLKQIPIIGSKSNLTKKIKKYSDEDLLLRVQEFEKKGVKGSFAYISPTKKLFELQDFTPYVKFTEGLSKKNLGGKENLPSKDTPIKDTPIKDDRSESIGLFINSLKQQFNIAMLGSVDQTNIINWCKELDFNPKEEYDKSSYLQGKIEGYTKPTIRMFYKKDTFIKMANGEYRNREDDKGVKNNINFDNVVF